MADLVNKLNMTLRGLRPMEKRYFTAKEIATYLGLSEHTIRAWVKLRQIPYYKFGRAVRFDLGQLEAWVKRQKCGFSDEDFHLQREKSIL